MKLNSNLFSVLLSLIFILSCARQKEVYCFNKNFEKCKVYSDEVEFGYGGNMEESTNIREDIKIDKLRLHTT